jgi:hypothetical protein
MGKLIASPTSGETKRFVAYEIHGAVRYDGWQVGTVWVEKVNRESSDTQRASETVAGEVMPSDHGEPGDRIVGTLTRHTLDQSGWDVPPHLALANLPSYDATGMMKLRQDDRVSTALSKVSSAEIAGRKPELNVDAKAVQKFVQTYGLLSAEDLPDLTAMVSDGAVDPRFHEDLSSFASAQELLRRAWAGDTSVVDIHLNTELDEGFELLAFEVNRPKSEVLLETLDLWKFTCFLFLVDYAKGRTRLCANPTCPAPYFLKRRITQKFCELGTCTEFAQRQYALRWWHAKGKVKQTESKGSRGKKSRHHRR